MTMVEIRFSGFGGQGVIRCGLITGKALALYDDKYATMTQSFGPEARGSACASALVIDEEVIAYPYLRQTDVLIALSREGYEKYIDELNQDGGILIYDQDMVEPQELKGTIKMYGVPAARLAEELGKRIVQNIVVVGFATAATQLVAKEAARKAVESSVPEALVDLNLQAFEKGYEYFDN